MCIGVSYQQYRKPYQSYFPQSGACLPIKLRNGLIKLLPWGRRQGESGTLPLTGWAKLASIKFGMWHVWRPHPVKIAIDAWMEKAEGISTWHALGLNDYLQGLIAFHEHERRVYVVTVEPRNDYDRVPRVITMDPSVHSRR